jgi:mono/diheme cytochrome c family protein
MLKNVTYIAAILLFGFFASSTSLAQAPGADTFKAKCAMCHGDDGLGNTSVGKALGVQSYKAPEVRKMSDAVLTTTIKNGKNNKMPAFAGQLTDAQVKDVIKYIHTLQK